MLILSRVTGQRVRLTIAGHLLKSGKPLVMDIELCSIRSLSRARIGFEGPREIRIEREELVIADDEHLADGRIGP